MPRRIDQTIVLYDHRDEFPPGTIGTFSALEGKKVAKDMTFEADPDGRFEVVDREVGEEDGHQTLTLHLARIR
jgi:hypothetical protein